MIDCTGSTGDHCRSGEPLIRQLLADGLVRPAPLGLGVDCTTYGALIGAKGQPAPDLFAVGPVTRGALWEIIAVPEIRAQAEQVAERVWPPPAAVPLPEPQSSRLDMMNLAMSVWEALDRAERAVAQATVELGRLEGERVEIDQPAAARPRLSLDQPDEPAAQALAPPCRVDPELLQLGRPAPGARQGTADAMARAQPHRAA